MSPAFILPQNVPRDADREVRSLHMWFFLPDELPALALIEVKGQSPAKIQDHRHETGVASAFLAMGRLGWNLQLL